MAVSYPSFSEPLGLGVHVAGRCRPIRTARVPRRFDEIVRPETPSPTSARITEENVVRSLEIGAERRCAADARFREHDHQWQVIVKDPDGLIIFNL